MSKAIDIRVSVRIHGKTTDLKDCGEIGSFYRGTVWGCKWAILSGHGRFDKFNDKDFEAINKKLALLVIAQCILFYETFFNLSIEPNDSSLEFIDGDLDNILVTLDGS